MLAAAIVTWVFATVTAVTAVLGTVLLLPFAGTFVEDLGFESSSVTRDLLEGAAVVLAVTFVADLVAFFVLRRQPWARWTLLLLSVSAGTASAMLGYYVVPLVVTAAAAAVVVLLLLPSTGRWFGGARTES